MAQGGAALMAVGHASGEDRAVKAAEQAISNQLLDITIDGARGILFNVTGGPNLTLFEVNQAASIIKETAHPDVNLIFGAVIDPNMGDDVRITVIATGFDRPGAVRTAVRPITLTKDETRKIAAPVAASVARIEPAVKSNEFETVYIDTKNIDLPTFLRNRFEGK
jgi:cell division protein FtsZ